MQLRLIIDIPENVKETIHNSLTQLRTDYPYIQWLQKNEYRLELFNFGDRYPKEHLTSKIGHALFEHRPFTLFTNRLGIYIKNTITVYVSFFESKELRRIVRDIKEQLSIRDELVFTPDIIVAKYRIPAKQQYLLLKKKCLNTRIDTEFRITQLTLYNSVNENNIIEYQKETAFPLFEEEK